MNLIRDLVPQRLPVLLPVLMSFDEIGPVLLPGQPYRALSVFGSASLHSLPFSISTDPQCTTEYTEYLLLEGQATDSNL